MNKAYLLNNPATVHAVREMQYVAHHPIREKFLLGLITILEKLLDDIISKHILHQLHTVLLDFAKYFILLVTVSSF